MTLRTLTVLCSALCLPVPAQDQDAPKDLARPIERKVEKVATGFRFVEGPAWHPLDQHLLFSDIPNNRIMKLGADGKVSVFLEPSGRANGLTIDRGGDLYACLGGDRQVVRIDAENRRAVVARLFGGKRLNSPNDLVLDDAGGLYFTDPRYGKADDLEQDKMAVYYVGADGRIRRVVDDLGKPNGIVMTPDGSGLYVAAPDQRAIYFYPVIRPGHLGPGTRIFQGGAGDGGGPDGMTVDLHGQIYATYDAVLVLGPAGALRQRIPVPEKPSNVTIGGGDGKTLYITARTSLYRCAVDHPSASEHAEASWLPPRMVRPRFESQTLSTEVGIGYGLALGDVNGDRRPDIILVDRQEVCWFENPARGKTWTRRRITGKLSQRDHVCLAVRDIDGDGKVEIAVGADWNPGNTMSGGKVFVLQPPADRGQEWTPVELPGQPTVHRMAWVRHDEGFDLAVLPLHGRGNKSGTGNAVELGLHRPPAGWPKATGGRFRSWTEDTGLHQTHGFDVVQWDEDPAEEIAIAGTEGIVLFDRQPPAAGAPDPATAAGDGTESGSPDPTSLRRIGSIADQTEGDTRFRGASEIRLGRAPGDQLVFAAVEPFHGHQLVLYSPIFPGTPRRNWRRRVVCDDLTQGHALAVGDLNGDGTPEIVVGWRGRPRPGGVPSRRVGIRVVLPHSARGELATKITIDDKIACEDLKLADLDGDGRLDIVAAGRSTHDLRIYFNRTDK